MQFKKLGITIIGIAAATLAYAVDSKEAAKTDVKPTLGKITCEQFLAFDEVYKPKVVYWAAGKTVKGKPENAIVDVEGVEKLVPVIITECQKDPKASFWQKVKEKAKEVFKR